MGQMAAKGERKVDVRKKNPLFRKISNLLPQAQFPGLYLIYIQFNPTLTDPPVMDIRL